jgi:UDP-glucose 4-epimerase
MASTGGAIYGRAAQLPTPETAPAQPLSPYGAAKLACEGYLGMFERSHGLRPLVLRYGNVYGPLQDGTGEAGLVAITCTRLLQGQRPVVRGDGGQTRDFVFVEDVAEANLRALRSDSTGVVNVGSGRGTSVREVVSALISASGQAVQPESAPLPEGEVRDSRLDVSLARTLLGWNPVIELDAGLARTYESFEARRANLVQ